MNEPYTLHITEIATEWDLSPLGCPPNVEHHHGAFVHLWGDVADRIVNQVLWLGRDAIVTMTGER